MKASEARRLIVLGAFLLLCPSLTSSFLTSGSTAIISSNNRPGAEPTQAAKKQTLLQAEKQSKTKGVYSRPSAAIERGSGFYIPGLEGYRVRILSGVSILALSFINTLFLDTPVSETASSLQVSINVANLFGLLLLLQALVDFGKETIFSMDYAAAQTTVKSAAGSNAVAKSNKIIGELQQIVSEDLTLAEKTYVKSIQWAAATFISLTPATSFLLVNRGNKILYSLGDVEREDAGLVSAGVDAAVLTVQESKGGRVAVPATHPVASLFSEEFRRCVLLQRVGDDSCFVVASNQLLPAFTKFDLKWLGNLSQLVGGKA
mmetsp:Transcript_25222/g.39025  ORF Transcript_25222/g.39025 Transcript_25222/m.39025 type:complete len:318 (-) Transcript_25222:14-967(-)